MEIESHKVGPSVYFEVDEARRSLRLLTVVLLREGWSAGVVVEDPLNYRPTPNPVDMPLFKALSGH